MVHSGQIECIQGIPACEMPGKGVRTCAKGGGRTLAWVGRGAAGFRSGPEGVLGLGKVGGGVLGVCGFFTASGIRSGPDGTCACPSNLRIREAALADP